MKAIRVALVLLLPVLCSAQISQQGIWTNDAMRCAFPVLLNGADINYMGASAPGLYTMDSVCGVINVPDKSVVSQSNGITGIVRNYSSSTWGMGGYFQVDQMAPHVGGISGGTAWGINTVLRVFSGADNAIAQNEADVDIFCRTVDGNAAACPSDVTVYGFSIQAPYWEAAPKHAAGVSVGRPMTTATGAVWDAAFESNDGASAVALVAGPNAMGSNSNSQVIQFTSLDRSSTRQNVYIGSDASGNFMIVPVAGKQLNVAGVIQSGGYKSAGGTVGLSLDCAHGVNMTKEFKIENGLVTVATCNP